MKLQGKKGKGRKLHKKRGEMHKNREGDDCYVQYTVCPGSSDPPEKIF